MRGLARLLFSFEGRIGRLQFWMAYIVLGVLMALLGLAQALVELALAHKSGTLNAVALGVVWLAIIPSIAISVKRFNDLGWPAWIVYALSLESIGIWSASYVGLAAEGSAYRTLLICANVTACGAIFIPCAFLRGRSPPTPATAATSA